MGRVSAVGQRSPDDAGGSVPITVDLGALAGALAHGASVAVNGVCLTVAGLTGSIATFDVIPETLRRTNLGALKPDDVVNIERSLRVGDRIDGHFVQGHVDGVGRISRISREGEWKVWVSPPSELLPFIVKKGSVALDGVSLTIADASNTSFSVALIPVTLERTVLGRRNVGDTLNIETDIMARTVVQYLARMLGTVGLAGALGPSYAAVARGSTQ